ncbi:MAG TPA: 4'-phosphopantetheinyl transferase superfamily protein [Candidatus Limnocylindrales bacterium]|nr:4'-phosphopantetheinyl transferase superfamily protein [Candidatus Limnocylindrales bacterium]
MIEKIVPASAAVAEAFGDLPDAVLLGEEERLIDRAIASRRREFTTVRHCARQAMTRLGINPVPVLRDPKGAPLWPEGVVGSMTHCAGYRAAVLAPATALPSIGIDAEPNAPLPKGVARLVMSPAEREALHSNGDVAWDRLLFSAKESIYKAWYPVVKRWLGFLDVDVIILHSGQFEAALLVPTGDLVGFKGRWHAERGLLVTAVAELVRR